MPIDPSSYNPKPTAEDWDQAWDTIIKDVQTVYIEAYEAEIKKKTQNSNINSANEAKSYWIDYIINEVKNPIHLTLKTDGARWLVEQIYVDEPDYPYKAKQPTLNGTENTIIQNRRQHMKTLENLKTKNPFA